jgi:hypothetical protein
MRYLLLFSLFLSLPLSSPAQTGNRDIYRFTERKGRHVVELVLRTRAFDQSSHRMRFTRRRDQINGPTGGLPSVARIDGRKPLGTSGTVPLAEIMSMTITFDGTKIVVPRSLYADCYNPNIDKDSFGTKLGDDGSSLLVFMAGSSKENSYQVIWILREDGQHSRFTNICAGCDYKNILNFFAKS